MTNNLDEELATAMTRRACSFINAMPIDNKLKLDIANTILAALCAVYTSDKEESDQLIVDGFLEALKKQRQALKEHKSECGENDSGTT